MSVRAIYRRWRPRRFDQIVGQDHITRALRNAVRTDRVAHGYLFCGPRGVAKTTTARVLAKAINCLNSENGEPCDRCELCVAIGDGTSYDVIEMDAASNGLVENVRDLRQHVLTHPDQARRKVYILDEAHRMSPSAFDALLKTLEEPPDHVVFMLVTSEAEKIPPTIVSRCQRFDFRRLPTAGIIGRLAEICVSEGIQVEPTSLETIARAATGSLRDAQSILDQILAYGEKSVRLADVELILGTAGASRVTALAQCALRRAPGDGLILIRDAVSIGVDPRVLGREVAAFLRSVLFAKVGGPDLLPDLPAEEQAAARELSEQIGLEHLMYALRQFGSVDANPRLSVHNQLLLELAFIESALWEPARAASPTSAARPAATSAPATGQTNVPTITPPVSGKVISRPSAIAHRAVPTRIGIPPRLAPAAPIAEATAPDVTRTGAPAPAPQVVSNDPVDLVEARRRWDLVRQSIASANRTIGTLLTHTRVDVVDADGLQIASQTQAHSDVVRKNTPLIREHWQKMFGQDVELTCSVAASWTREPGDPSDIPEIKRALQRGWRVKQVDSGAQPIQSATGSVRSDDRATEHEDDSADAAAADEGPRGTR